MKTASRREHGTRRRQEGQRRGRSLWIASCLRCSRACLEFILQTMQSRRSLNSGERTSAFWRLFIILMFFFYNINIRSCKSLSKTEVYKNAKYTKLESFFSFIPVFSREEPNTVCVSFWIFLFCTYCVISFIYLFLCICLCLPL